MKSRVINTDQLFQEFPTYPTHKHDPKFWEALGRTIATFGFLEEVLGKAIYAFGKTRRNLQNESEEEFKKWILTLEKALTDQLGALIDSYEKEVKNHPSKSIENLGDLVEDLRKTKELRNVLCHGSWQVPNDVGRTIPFFVNRKKEIFKTEIDILFLMQTQRHVSELCCMVVNTVTHMGWQFPGSNGPGEPVWSYNSSPDK